MEEQKKPTDELKRGVITFVALAVLTAVEYIIGIAELPGVLLWMVALLKAGLVLWFFMHLGRVFSTSGGHE